jgi:hypothetical protein
MKVLYFILTCLFLSYATNAQELLKDNTHLHHTYAQHLPLSIFLEPAALLPIGNNGAARVGIEIPVSKRVSFLPILCVYPNGSGIKGIVKYYYGKPVYVEKKRPVWNVYRRYYTALEYYYKAYRYNNHDSVTIPPYRERVYHVEKYATTISITFGMISTLGSGLYCETFAGGGVRIKTVNNDLQERETDHFYHWHAGEIQDMSDDKALDKLLPHIALGFRVGWRYR